MKPLSTIALVHALSGLRTNAASCSSPGAHATLTQALASRQAAPVVAAANLIAEYKLRGWGDALRSAFHELAGEKASTLDPGSLAKEAVVTALDVETLGIPKDATPAFMNFNALGHTLGRAIIAPWGEQN